MLINFVRAIILYIVVFITTRLMGKREIGQLQPFEVVISIMIANLATIPMSDTGVPIVSGLVPIMGLLTMHLIISLLNLKSTKIRKILCGKPNIIINKGKIDEEAMEKERFDLSELEEKLREKDVFDIGDVDYAILETNGDVSVILKPEKQQPTAEDLNLNPDFLKKALLHFQYIGKNVGIMANDEDKYCFDRNNNSDNVVFNSSVFKDVLWGNDMDVYYI